MENEKRTIEFKRVVYDICIDGTEVQLQAKDSTIVIKGLFNELIDDADDLFFESKKYSAEDHRYAQPCTMNEYYEEYIHYNVKDYAQKYLEEGRFIIYTEEEVTYKKEREKTKPNKIWYDDHELFEKDFSKWEFAFFMQYPNPKEYFRANND